MTFKKLYKTLSHIALINTIRGRFRRAAYQNRCIAIDDDFSRDTRKTALLYDWSIIHKVPICIGHSLQAKKRVSREYFKYAQTYYPNDKLSSLMAEEMIVVTSPNYIRGRRYEKGVLIDSTCNDDDIRCLRLCNIPIAGGFVNKDSQLKKSLTKKKRYAA